VIKRLDEGDVLLVTRLDRLARSTRDLLNTLDTIAKRGAAFRSLADSWADTTTPHGKLMPTILGGLAEFERELIRARTGEGRKRAKARGVHMGRPPKLTPDQRREAIAHRDNARRMLAGITTQPGKARQRGRKRFETGLRLDRMRAVLPLALRRPNPSGTGSEEEIHACRRVSPSSACTR
jgi:DNA invertase Pin-like site-specific DNA recombinase